VESDKLRLLGVVASLDGSEIVRASASGPADEPEALGATVARTLLEQGAGPILESVNS
jgi:hydroxymethylbilane synthase